jgi:hypothetical protein
MHVVYPASYDDGAAIQVVANATHVAVQLFLKWGNYKGLSVLGAPNQMDVAFYQ